MKRACFWLGQSYRNKALYLNSSAFDCDCQCQPAESLCGLHRARCCSCCDLRVSCLSLAVWQTLTGAAFGCTALVVFTSALYAFTPEPGVAGNVDQNASQNAIAFALVIYQAARWLFTLFTGLLGIVVCLRREGILTYSARVIRHARLWHACCWVILISDLNPLSWSAKVWQSRATAALAGAGYVPLFIDALIVYYSWSLAHKLCDQREGIFEGLPVMRSQNKPSHIVSLQHPVHLTHPHEHANRTTPHMAPGMVDHMTRSAEVLHTEQGPSVTAASRLHHLLHGVSRPLTRISRPAMAGAGAGASSVGIPSGSAACEALPCDPEGASVRHVGLPLKLIEVASLPATLVLRALGIDRARPAVSDVVELRPLPRPGKAAIPSPQQQLAHTGVVAGGSTTGHPSDGARSVVNGSRTAAPQPGLLWQSDPFSSVVTEHAAAPEQVQLLLRKPAPVAAGGSSHHTQSGPHRGAAAIPGSRKGLAIAVRPALVRPSLAPAPASQQVLHTEPQLPSSFLFPPSGTEAAVGPGVGSQASLHSTSYPGQHQHHQNHAYMPAPEWDDDRATRASSHTQSSGTVTLAGVWRRDSSPSELDDYHSVGEGSQEWQGGGQDGSYSAEDVEEGWAEEPQEEWQDGYGQEHADGLQDDEGYSLHSLGSEGLEEGGWVGEEMRGGSGESHDGRSVIEYASDEAASQAGDASPCSPTIAILTNNRRQARSSKQAKATPLIAQNGLQQGRRSEAGAAAGQAGGLGARGLRKVLSYLPFSSSRAARLSTRDAAAAAAVAAAHSGKAFFSHDNTNGSTTAATPGTSHLGSPLRRARTSLPGVEEEEERGQVTITLSELPLAHPDTQHLGTVVQPQPSRGFTQQQHQEGSIPSNSPAVPLSAGQHNSLMPESSLSSLVWRLPSSSTSTQQQQGRTAPHQSPPSTSPQWQQRHHHHHHQESGLAKASRGSSRTPAKASAYTFDRPSAPVGTGLTRHSLGSNVRLKQQQQQAPHHLGGTIIPEAGLQLRRASLNGSLPEAASRRQSIGNPQAEPVAAGGTGTLDMVSRHSSHSRLSTPELGPAAATRSGASASALSAHSAFHTVAVPGRSLRPGGPGSASHGSARVASPAAPSGAGAAVAGGWDTLASLTDKPQLGKGSVLESIHEDERGRKQRHGRAHHRRVPSGDRPTAWQPQGTRPTAQGNMRKPSYSTSGTTAHTLQSVHRGIVGARGLQGVELGVQQAAAGFLPDGHNTHGGEQLIPEPQAATSTAGSILAGLKRLTSLKIRHNPMLRISVPSPHHPPHSPETSRINGVGGEQLDGGALTGRLSHLVSPAASLTSLRSGQHCHPGGPKSSKHLHHPHVSLRTGSATSQGRVPPTEVDASQPLTTRRSAKSHVSHTPHDVIGAPSSLSHDRPSSSHATKPGFAQGPATSHGTTPAGAKPVSLHSMLAAGDRKGGAQPLSPFARPSAQQQHHRGPAAQSVPTPPASQAADDTWGQGGHTRGAVEEEQVCAFQLRSAATPRVPRQGGQGAGGAGLAGTPRGPQPRTPTGVLLEEEGGVHGVTVQLWGRPHPDRSLLPPTQSATSVEGAEAGTQHRQGPASLAQLEPMTRPDSQHHLQHVQQPQHQSQQQPGGHQSILERQPRSSNTHLHRNFLSAAQLQLGSELHHILGRSPPSGGEAAATKHHPEGQAPGITAAQGGAGSTGSTGAGLPPRPPLIFGRAVSLARGFMGFSDHHQHPSRLSLEAVSGAQTPLSQGAALQQHALQAGRLTPSGPSVGSMQGSGTMPTQAGSSAFATGAGMWDGGSAGSVTGSHVAQATGSANASADTPLARYGQTSGVGGLSLHKRSLGPGPAVAGIARSSGYVSGTAAVQVSAPRVPMTRAASMAARSAALNESLARVLARLQAEDAEEEHRSNRGSGRGETGSPVVYGPGSTAGSQVHTPGPGPGTPLTGGGGGGGPGSGRAAGTQAGFPGSGTMSSAAAGKGGGGWGAAGQQHQPQQQSWEGPSSHSHILPPGPPLPRAVQSGLLAHSNGSAAGSAHPAQQQQVVGRLPGRPSLQVPVLEQHDSPGAEAGGGGAAVKKVSWALPATPATPSSSSWWPSVWSQPPKPAGAPTQSVTTSEIEPA